jgi:hypothetical protein
VGTLGEWVMLNLPKQGKKIPCALTCYNVVSASNNSSADDNSIAGDNSTLGDSSSGGDKGLSNDSRNVYDSSSVHINEHEIHSNDIVHK